MAGHYCNIFKKESELRMKQRGKPLFCLAFLVISLPFFTGCGGGGGSDQPAAANQVSEQSSTSPYDAQVASVDEEPVERTEYKMAFILLTMASDSPETIEMRINQLTSVKENFSNSFKTATLGYAAMDTSYAVISMFIQPQEIENISCNTDFFKKFYQSNPDDFDFISIFHDASLSGRMYHQNIKNNIEGIGLRDFDFSSSYGSEGKLLGINVIPYIPSTVEEKEILSMNALLHETGHQWGVYIGENFSNDPNAVAMLEIKQQNIHFYRGLASPYQTGTPMFSDRWVANGDGTFHRENLQNMAQKYHPIQLYLMGIYHADNYDFSTKFQIYNSGGGDTDLPFDPENAVLYKEISINEIVDLEGERGYF